MNANPYLIVTGVDGSAASKQALRWAVWKAEITGGAVTAITAWNYPAIYTYDHPTSDDFTRWMHDALSDAVTEVAGTTHVNVTKTVERAHPAQALLRATEHADLLVVGNRGHGGFTSALLGSVSQHCVQHADVPVVVIRATEQ